MLAVAATLALLASHAIEGPGAVWVESLPPALAAIALAAPPSIASAVSAAAALVLLAIALLASCGVVYLPSAILLVLSGQSLRASGG